MAETCFREIAQVKRNLQPVEEIIIPTGASQSLLQDVKFPECAGSYAYKDSCSIGSFLNNQFITWKVSGEVLEVSEDSLDYNLIGNSIKFRFQGSPVLDGVTIHETNTHVVFLVATVSSVHRLLFPHPKNFNRQNQECVMTTDVVSHAAGEHALMSGSQNHMLRKAYSQSQNCLYLAAFLCFKTQCQFNVFKPSYISGQYQLDLIATIYGAQGDLIDFQLSTTHLWSLWANKDGDTVVSCAPLNGRTSTENIQVFLNKTQSMVLPGHGDVAERFMEEIFRPGQFTQQTIVKVVNMTRRLGVTGSTLEAVDVQALHEKVLAAVDYEARTCQTEDFDLLENELYEAQAQAWTNFYSSCIQYNKVGMKPLGIGLDSETGQMLLLNRQAVSYIRPCDTLEHLDLAEPGNKLYFQFLQANMQNIDTNSWQDVAILMECMHIFGRFCEQTTELYSSFEQDMKYNTMPECIADKIVVAVISKMETDGSEDSCLHKLSKLIQGMSDVAGAIDTVLELLDLAHGHPEGLQVENTIIEVAKSHGTRRLLSSQSAVRMLGICFFQLAETRFSICRDLLIMQVFLTTLDNRSGLSLEMIKRLKSECIMRTAVMLRASAVLRWISTTSAVPVPSSQLESSVRQLGVLQITGLMERSQNNRYDDGVTLAELFIDGVGGNMARGLMIQNGFLTDELSSSWKQASIPLVTFISQLVWPVSIGFVFPEFLLVKCQYSALMEYIKMVDSWCDWNPASRHFLLAFCYLNLGEPYKACDLFLKAGDSIQSYEPFLMRLLGETDSDSKESLRVLFYLKVTRLLEEFDLPDVVLSFATAVINSAQVDNPNVPTLWSLIFKYHLELGHYDEAYSALNSNPDATRHKDCLRQFIIVLCERKELSLLVSFPYIDLQADVVRILESRSRSVQLTTHSYYELLYSFHMLRGDYRKAGSVMYEYGRRLGQEVAGMQALQQQVRCYLTAMNALRVGSPEYAWIVRPAHNVKNTKHEPSPWSKYEDVEGDEPKPCFESKVQVLELADIEKEYLLLNNMLKLMMKGVDLSSIAGRPPTPFEVVSMLCTAGMFDSAILVCEAFQLSKVSVFEALTSRCVRLSQNCGNMGDNNYTVEAWEWLDNNEIDITHPAKEITSSEQAWRLLQMYLEKHPDYCGSAQLRCIATRLLCLGITLPSWLSAIYKRVNAAELLRLYIDYDLLTDAASLVIEYINAALGNGKEHFNLKTALHSTTPPVWLPYSEIDQLLLVMKSVQHDALYIKLYEDLRLKLADYHRTVETVSQDYVRAASKRKNVAEI
ncbi:PREDICTED: nuclear pore complex protein Nup160-like isoform X2 [Priapulus caudatus]|uniref:Nuclear pore complex protein Nup160-like isoform X2 n=1 Tax=Priapulus caudatus TaxID=37621 RepID=A0ABM1F0F9_PRICU|nr:PREDICTED: nuclear pore complex protein Nup160-like isoform X2 [Priapulus caudatus]